MIFKYQIENIANSTKNKIVQLFIDSCLHVYLYLNNIIKKFSWCL